MRSKRISINGKRYILYEGKHSELIDIMKEGDLVTLLRRSEDGSEVAKIIGVVKFTGMAFVGVSVAGANRTYSVDQSSECPPAYKVTCIKRPVEGMLPDSPGPWLDKDGDTWIVNDDLNAMRVSSDGTWWLGGGVLTSSEYAEYAPFTKLTTIEEHAK